MIKGIGTDIIEIDRVAKAIESNNTFLKRCFTHDEIELFKSRNYNKSTMAANFAVKEAVSKVFGTGFVGISLTDIETLRDTRGKPFINLYGKALEMQIKLHISELYVSISHSKKDAIAFVVAEGE